METEKNSALTNSKIHIFISLFFFFVVITLIVEWSMDKKLGDGLFEGSGKRG